MGLAHHDLSSPTSVVPSVVLCAATPASFARSSQCDGWGTEPRPLLVFLSRLRLQWCQLSEPVNIGALVSPRRPTAAQRRASARNLAKARQVAAARRRRASSGAGTGLAILVAVVIVLGLVVALVRSTHGLILLLVPAGIMIAVATQRSRHQQANLERMQAHQERMAFAADLGRLLSLSPAAFERAVAELLSVAAGYQGLRCVGGPNDRGADLLGYDHNGFAVVVQCKRYAPGHSVASADLQRFIGAIAIHGAQHGVFVSTSAFSRPARDLAAAHRITLVDGQALVALAQRALPRSETNSPWGPPPVPGGVRHGQL